MSDLFWSQAMAAAERGWIPDVLLRSGIRRLCKQRLVEEDAKGVSVRTFAESVKEGPIAPVPEKANEQHYEVPPALFEAVLGKRMKYSSCFWPEGVTTLDQAEEAALEVTCSRADLADGQAVLELGCGWGSLSLWMAERYPNSRITAVSNSGPQRRFIEARAKRLGLTNLRVITRDMNELELDERFDRVVSVEMFEHMRNYERLLEHVAGWLQPDGKLFVHVFCHRRYSYAFEVDGAANWLGKHFFTGGVMPGADLLPQFDRHLRVAEQWSWSGRHYEKTANAWAANLDAKRDELLPILAETYGEAEAERWLERWKIFFLACAELWGYADGTEWKVAHYLFEPVAHAGELASAVETAGVA